MIEFTLPDARIRGVITDIAAEFIDTTFPRVL